jgi:hypothetical protein
VSVPQAFLEVHVFYAWQTDVVGNFAATTPGDHCIDELCKPSLVVLGPLFLLN